MDAVPPPNSSAGAPNPEILPRGLLKVADWVTTETAARIRSGSVLFGLDDVLAAHLPDWITALSDREIEFLLWAVELGHREALEVENCHA